MTEPLHRDIQALRRNVFEVIACLRDADVFFCLNHLMHFWRPEVPLGDYLRLLDHVPALEVRNGAMLPKHNRLSERLAAEPTLSGGRRLAMVAGSDAHTLRRVGTTWTEAEGRSRDEFMDKVRRGLGSPGGRDGGALAVSADAYGVIRGYIASLLGILPSDHQGLRRLACLGFAIGSLPFEFVTLLLVSRTKIAERRKTAMLEAAVSEWLVGGATVDARA
jgi:hypothetical protein